MGEPTVQMRLQGITYERFKEAFLACKSVIYHYLITIYLSQFCFKGAGQIYFLLRGKLCKQMNVTQ